MAPVYMRGNKFLCNSNNLYFASAKKLKSSIMLKTRTTIALIFMACLFSLSSFAQTIKVSGTVKNSSSGEDVPAVSVTVKGTSAGVFTSSNGTFSINVSKFPVTLVFSSIGYETQEVTVNSGTEAVSVKLVQTSALGQEVVVSATRVASRILESPVTIERVSASAIRNAPAASYYDVVNNLKGVDVMAASLTFKTPTTRGFNGSGNTRFTQIVDGMDNQAPGLNFSVGSVIGLSELDVDNMELLPGASSALYGPGGMNGTLLINSKSPFKYQGLSFQVKQGMMHTDRKYRNASPYYNWGFRWAEKIGQRAAFKITADFLQAQDWLAADQRNYKRLGTSGGIVPGTRTTDPNYDGVNVYGDETTIDLRLVLNGIAQQAPFLAGYINTLTGSPINVSRTGYTEKELIDPETLNFKLGGAFHYKITDNIEAVVMGYWGTGNTVYTGSDRYSLRGLKMGQYKFELNSKNWFLRAWTTQENAGESYNATVTTRLTNEKIKPSATWYTEYGQSFLNSKLNGLSDIDAHNSARALADLGRPAASSAQFKQLFDEVRKVPISKGGGLFVDKTDLYSVEGQYNFSHVTRKFADILIGGNFRRFVLNSQGTLFADSAGVIPINEFGGYLQVSRKLINEKLTLTGSVRYDKNQNFDGRFTPRATAVYQINKNNNIRLSFQTAYRFPSTQQQWINLNVGGNVQLIGGVPEFATFYKFNTNPIYTLESIQGGAPKTTTFPPFKAESVTSYEIGYKGLVADNKLLVDVYAYYGQYQNFTVRQLVAQSNNGNPAVFSNPANLTNPAVTRLFSVPTNTPNKVTTYGYGIGLEYRLPRNFYVNANASSDILQDVPAGFVAFFNSPKYRTNLIFGNNAFGKDKRLGFNITYRWQDAYFYESDFTTGAISAVNLLDAQLSYRLPKIKSIFKVGANNLLNQYYVQGAGNPSIGGLYYVGFAYNVF
jgi:outer membrane receptor protein involved in Fe transport